MGSNHDSRKPCGMCNLQILKRPRLPKWTRNTPIGTASVQSGSESAGHDFEDEEGHMLAVVARCGAQRCCGYFRVSVWVQLPDGDDPLPMRFLKRAPAGLGTSTAEACSGHVGGPWPESAHWPTSVPVSDVSYPARSSNLRRNVARCKTSRNAATAGRSAVCLRITRS